MKIKRPEIIIIKDPDKLVAKTYHTKNIKRTENIAINTKKKSGSVVQSQDVINDLNIPIISKRKPSLMSEEKIKFATKSDMKKLARVMNIQQNGKTNPDIIKLCFLGEFGFFIMTAIGAIEAYLYENPKKRLVVFSYEDYCRILNLLFPDKILAFKIYRGPSTSGNRECLGIVAHQTETELIDYIRTESAGYVDIEFLISHIRRKANYKIPGRGRFLKII